MREIRFRAWDKQDKKMYEVAHISNLLTVGTFISVRKNPPSSIIKVERDLEEGDYILMQFTGLKDKNGKDIYEGDVVKGNVDYHRIGICTAVVEYYNGGFTPFADSNDYAPYPTSDDVEIVGNIYENHELLEA